MHAAPEEKRAFHDRPPRGAAGERRDGQVGARPAGSTACKTADASRASALPRRPADAACVPVASDRPGRYCEAPFGQSRADGLATLCAGDRVLAFSSPIPAAALVVLGVFSLFADPQCDRSRRRLGAGRAAGRGRGPPPAEALSARPDRPAATRWMTSARARPRAVDDDAGGGQPDAGAHARVRSGGLPRSSARKRLVSLLIACRARRVCRISVAILSRPFGPHLERRLGSTLDGRGSQPAWARWTARKWPFLLGFLLLVSLPSPSPGPQRLRPARPAPGGPALPWRCSCGWPPPGPSPSTSASFGSANNKKLGHAGSAVVVTSRGCGSTSAALLFGAGKVNAGSAAP